MDIFDIITILMVFIALFSYLNYRYFHLPRSIGLMLASLILSSVLIVAGQFDESFRQNILAVIGQIDFHRLLLQGLLGFLLFAGALNVDLNRLMEEKWVIVSLATAGVILSTFIVGGLAWLVMKLLAFPISFTYCLLFGALISPTDPVAVLNVLKRMEASESLETQMAGESLFNDGVGVVLFMVLLRITGAGNDPGYGQAIILFAEEAFGGILLGVCAGYLAYQMLKRVDNYEVEILITLGLVTGGYTLANILHTSGPLAMVVAGLLIGNHGRRFAMSETTRKNLDTFWELIDEIINAVLFVLIGMEVLVLVITPQHLLAGLLMIPMVLLARLTSVGIPIGLLKFKLPFGFNLVRILTWGGLRGGIAVALALSLPESPARGMILAVTYFVVIFSISVQGLTVQRLLRRWK